ncbi:MAG: hypothetical protein ACYDHD_02560 [Vulcanimicrobiaceae bacterium]
MIHVNVASPAGAYSVGNAAFFHYILRLEDLGVPLSADDAATIDVLGAIPHAFDPDEEARPAGFGWRIVPPQNEIDWIVLETTPERLRLAFERAQRILWHNAAECALSAREIMGIDAELEAVYSILTRAEDGGFWVNVSYV